MTSQITPNIDGTFPIAGQDNSTQGFRDNFTNTNNNFTFAAAEISDLQSKALLKSALSGDELNNDMQGSVISNPSLRSYREFIYDFGTVSGNVGINFNSGNYHVLTLGGSIILSLIGFTTSIGSLARVKLQITVPNVGYTVTFPASVTTNLTTISGSSGQTVSFTDAGVYIFELSTIDGGTSFAINDLTRPRDTVQNGYLAIQTSIANVATSGIVMTVSNVNGVAVGNITATNIFGNIIALNANSSSFTGNVTANNFIANTGIYGNIKSPLQTGITLVGTLSSVSVTGNANVGNLTTSGLTDMCGGDAYGVQLVAATNAGTTQILSNVGFVLLNPAGTISSHSLTMPETPMNGQQIRIGFANNVTTLTQGGAGTDTVYGAITTGNTAGGSTWIYYKTGTINSGNGAWYRVG